MGIYVLLCSRLNAADLPALGRRSFGVFLPFSKYEVSLLFPERKCYAICEKMYSQFEQILLSTDG